MDAMNRLEYFTTNLTINAGTIGKYEFYLNNRRDGK